MSDSSPLPNDIRHDVEALLNGRLDQPGVRRLETALLNNPRRQQQFLDYCQLHTDLALSTAADRAVGSSFDLLESHSVPPSPIKTILQGTAKFFTQPTPFSMTVAALVIGLLITVMAFTVPPFYRAIAGVGKVNLPPHDSQRIVAELTAVHEPRWAPGQLTPNRGAFLQAGRRMELERGLIELTFRGGAMVTIEGPSTWTVASEGALQLESGQVAADVPASAVGFKVRTPAAEIIDLSTSFGVKATQDTTDVHVFQGAVEATFLATDGTVSSTMRVNEGESIAWDALAEQVERHAFEEDAFARHVPRRQLLPVFSTGKGLAVGQADPHWKITKALGDPTFEPQAAVVTTFPNAIPNDIDQSQWISNGHPPPNTHGSETFTYRTSFDLHEFDPGTATLRVRFAVDNLVTAIRLNGKPVSVPAHEYGEATFQSFLRALIADGFVQRENILELDVFNADDKSYMGLRVELSGTALEQH